ncbi:MAG: hypothetical protein OIF55_12985 [Amphritea sp.]|nr:hypothetical protein [Amphritea sp.]
MSDSSSSTDGDEFDLIEDQGSSSIDLISELDNLNDPELQAAEKHSKKRLNVSLSLGKSYSLLVFQTGSFGLRCALARKGKTGVQFGAVVESSRVDFTQAIADVLSQLKPYQRILPRKAILLTPSVISAVVDLPVSPLRPRSDEEMQELIRWELEGAVSQQNKQWLIGAMLVERGYLTQSQRDELVTELKLRQSQASESGVGGGLIRFGELAIELGYIEREQLDECFALQAKLVSLDDELVYGWQAEEQAADQRLSDEALLSKEEDSNSSHPWLVCGMSKTIRRRWLGAFALNSVRVEAFYPALGSSFAVLANTAEAKLDEQLLLEVHQEQLVAITGSSRAVRRIEVAERQPGELRLEELTAVLGELPENHNTIYLNLQGQSHEALMFALESGFRDRNFVQLHYPQGVGGLVTNLQLDALTGMVGAAEHYMGVVAPPALSWIPTRDAELSLIKKLSQPKVLRIAAAVVLGVAMIGADGWMFWNWNKQTQRLSQLDEQYENDVKLKQQFDQIRAEQKMLAERIRELSDDNVASEVVIIGLSHALVQEKYSAGLILKAASVSATEGISLRSLERSENKINLVVAAIADAEAQQFSVTLSQILKPAGIEVLESEQKRDSEQNSIYPYVLNLDLLESTAVTQVESSVEPAEGVAL